MRISMNPISQPPTMPGPANTLLIEGSFEELSTELSTYIDNLRKVQGEDEAVRAEVEKHLQEPVKKDDALKALVGASAILNSAPEKELIAAYNLLVHLARQAQNPDMFFARICQNLSKPITSSPSNGPGLALSILGTVFNLIPSGKDSRRHVLLAILQILKQSSNNFEAVRPQLKNLGSWLAQWDADEEDQREVYMAVNAVAEESGEEDAAYEYLLKSLQTFPADQASSEDARRLSLQALRAALVQPSHFDFEDLNVLDSVQALRKSDPIYAELLDIFTSDQLEDYNDFKDAHEGWIDQEKLDGSALNRKMRLLTLASLAAQNHQSGTLPYANIAKALQIPSEDVEMWVIDVIRAGLVEGKLSQLDQVFLVHRCTYRHFGDNQWREVASRLDLWRRSLTGVLGVIRREKESYSKQRQQDAKDIDAKLQGF